MTRILIVDDNARVRAALRLCLKMKEDWVVCGEADNGDAAIELVRTVKPDVVLLDYAMPVMNGLEAARAMSALAPECALTLNRADCPEPDRWSRMCRSYTKPDRLSPIGSLNGWVTKSDSSWTFDRTTRFIFPRGALTETAAGGAPHGDENSAKDKSSAFCSSCASRKAWL